MAHDIAKAIAGSSLVKAAVFGADPNWGRVLATVGARAGSQRFPIDPYGAEVRIQGIPVYRGEPVIHDAAQLKARMREPEVRVDVALGSGASSAVAWGCDLTYDYVKINADYTSLIVQKPDGGVAKDDRLSNYSPSFKVSLLVEALAYISKFAGKRCVIKVGGEALVKEPLKAALCHDVGLLRSVGLFPVVVHGGGPEMARTFEKLGARPEMIDGVPLTDASDSKVVEMVLTGAVSTELVTLINRDGAHAVGVSGKDGALFRARKYVPENGRDLGSRGEITSVNRGLLEMLLQQGYIPIISPVGLGDDGQGYHLEADAVAAEVAAALGASKLIYLTNVPGLLERAELVTHLSAQALQQRVADGVVLGGMRRKAEAALKALAGGVERVHLLDGRNPHSIIAELFTDRGVGTLVQS
jgi:acetylglutamate kinase